MSKFLEELKYWLKFLSFLGFILGFPALCGLITYIITSYFSFTYVLVLTLELVLLGYKDKRSKNKNLPQKQEKKLYDQRKDKKEIVVLKSN